MARLFVSCLGTGKYDECMYSCGEGQPTVQTRFIQVALAKTRCADWSKEDRIVVLITDEAEKKNWKDSEHNGNRGLQSELNDLKLSATFIDRKIPIGSSEEEQMNIFKILVDSINNGDKVFLDITHAFRSIPLLVSVVLDYAKVVKGIEVEGVFYGCFEKLQELGGAKNLPVEDRLVPIFDMSGLLSIKDWTAATESFMSTGDARAIEKVASRKYFAPVGVGNQLGNGESDDSSVFKANRYLVNGLKNFSASMLTCRSLLQAEITNLKKSLNDISKVRELEPLYPLFDKVSCMVEKFGADDVSNAFEAAKWCHERNLIQQSYVFFLEAAISELVLLAGGDVSLRIDREIAARSINQYCENVTDESKNGVDEKRELMQACYKIISEGKLRIPVSEIQALRAKRNDFMHGGWVDPSKPVRLIKLIENALTSLKESDTMTPE